MDRLYENIADAGPFGSVYICKKLIPYKNRIAGIRSQKFHCPDIVLYRRKQGLLVLHRIYKCTDKGFYMVGDNQTEVEGPIEYEQIKGIMTAVIRKQKKISAGNFFYAFAGSLWLVLRPVRMYIAKPVAAVKKIFRKVVKS